MADPTKKWYNYDADEWANAVLISNKGFAADLSGNERHAEFVGGAQIGEEGLVLDGNDDGIFLDDMVKDIFQHSNTIQIKVKRQEINAWGILIGNYRGESYPFIQYEIGTNNIHYLWWSHKADTTGGSYTSKDFVTITYIYDKENGTITVYNDKDKSFTAQSDVYKNEFGDYIDVYIGRSNSQTGANSKALQGIIEKVMIYDDILTEDEIQQNLNATSGKIGEGGVVEDNMHLYYDFKVPQTVDTTPGKILDMRVISQMYVWIPRYKYQLFNAIAGDSVPEQMIDIKFESGGETTGTVKCTIAPNGNETCSGAANGEWYTHPAFTFGDTDLTGIWVGKFEPSDAGDLTGKVTNQIRDLTILPNKISMVNKSIKTSFDYVQKMETDQNEYNLKAMEIDAHLMKNIDWGAVAYLSNSKYGIYNSDGETCSIDGCKIYKNNTTFEDYGTVTGCAGTAANSPTISGVSTCPGGRTWDTEAGAKASTTGNMYGIYDMNGGMWEYVMGSMANSNGTFYSSSSGFQNVTPEIDKKYYDKYGYGTSYLEHKRGHLGDATRETMSNYGNDAGGWNEDASCFLYNTNSWFPRGGSHRWSNNTGIFAFHCNTGAAHSEISFRVVLTAQDGNE